MGWKYIFELSYRNLVSQRSRSVLTIGGVGIGITAIIFLVSLGYGLERLAVKETIQSKSLKIIDTRVGTGAISKIDDSLITKLKGFNGVTNIYPRLETPVNLSVKGSQAKADMTAFINNNDYTKQSDSTTTTGRLPSDEADEVVITTAALKVIGIEDTKADNLELQITPLIRSDLMPDPTKPTSETATLKVVGIIGDTDNPFVIVPIKAMQKVSGNFAFTYAKVEVSDKEQVDNTRKQITDLGMEVEYIGDTVKELEGIFRIARIILAGFGLIATMVAALGMFNTLSVSLLERTREIGIMKTLGTKRKEVWQLFLVEGMLISILGGVVGIVLGVGGGQLLNLIFNIIAKTTKNPTSSFYYSPPVFLAIIMSLVVLLGALVGLIPARRATKISPLEALRYE